MLGLTSRQCDCLGRIAELTARRGFAPTNRELGVALGIASTNGVQDHLKALMRKGYLTREPTLARSLQLTEKARALLATLAEEMAGQS